VRVRFADLPADLPARLAGPEVPYRAEVVVDATSRLGQHHFELDRRGTVRLATAMKLSVTGDFALRIVRLRAVRVRPGLEGLTVTANLEVRNVFPFPLAIRRVDYSVSLGGAHLADGSHDRPLRLGPGATERVEMALRVPLARVADVMRALGRGGTEARVRGRAHISPIGGIAEVPFDVRLDPALLRGVMEGR
jgi:LEA14-like dessication related protein